jgi:hypothetical protein
MDVNDEYKSVSDMTTDELKTEFDEVKGAAENEKIWADGSSNRETKRMHLGNIAWLNDRADEIEEELNRRDA